ncbi:MAG: type I glyceraldehyde-3-phosphate dehydrogenase [Candidatus Diapherotrites archaeon CG08_land_8_20_14_0_20_34_12]|nr:MAG: type I glyceraldehyde-3-phosphate dehydrogenase [Candidatus Diapherotrites archaeon CG08_land_8_20_14_0_20_34_12]
MVRVAINGFGRIGRAFFRAGYKKLEIVAINDLAAPGQLAYLLKHDSVYGRFNAKVEVKDKSLFVDGKEVKIFGEKDPAALPWTSLKVGFVVESTGLFRDTASCNKHIQAGAKKVLVSAPPKGTDVKQLVIGVNEKEYDPSKHHIVSNASCTTNSLAPIVKLLDDAYGIDKGFMTTIHAYTQDQRLLDSTHSDLRRARSAAINIIPTTTGAASAVGEVMPHMKGKLDGIALRVPVADGSITDFTVLVKRETTAEEVNNLVKKAAQANLKGIVEYSEEELVSSDIIGNTHSSIFDSGQTMVNKNLVKVCMWYDNECGYSNRLVDLILLMNGKK